jgi:hypothetical protein
VIDQGNGSGCTDAGRISVICDELARREATGEGSGPQMREVHRTRL